jgi:hypothetical protein
MKEYLEPSYYMLEQCKNEEGEFVDKNDYRIIFVQAVYDKEKEAESLLKKFEVLKEHEEFKIGRINEKWEYHGVVEHWDEMRTCVDDATKKCLEEEYYPEQDIEKLLVARVLYKSGNQYCYEVAKFSKKLLESSGRL